MDNKSCELDKACCLPMKDYKWWNTEDRTIEELTPKDLQRDLGRKELKYRGRIFLWDLCLKYSRICRMKAVIFDSRTDKEKSWAHSGRLIWRDLLYLFIDFKGCILQVNITNMKLLCMKRLFREQALLFFLQWGRKHFFNNSKWFLREMTN